MRLILCFCVVAVFSSVATLMAAPIRGGSASANYRTTYMSRLYPGTPFNPGTDPVEVPGEATGVLVYEWQDQVGDTIMVEAVSIRASGELPGPPPIPFELFGGVQEAPELGPWLASYTNVVQDPSDPGYAAGDPSSLVSADYQSTGRFFQVLADGTTLYTGPAELVGEISGIPAPIGTQFTIAREVDLYLQLGAEPDPMGDPIIGVNLPGGIFEVIPEPSGFGLAIIAAAAFATCRRRRC